MTHISNADFGGSTRLPPMPAKSSKFTLPISPSYVSHWGLWEAVRELVQNALDHDEANGNGDPWQSMVDWEDDERFEKARNVLTISTYSGRLDESTLVLGNGTKASDKASRGKFGEGYKLALLVLCRLGYEVEVLNNGDIWRPRIERDEQFNSDVLNIYVEKRGYTEDKEDEEGGVSFVIRGVTAAQFADISRNIRQPPKAPEIIDPGERAFPGDWTEKGRIYVGGLYVTTMKDFEFGYSFTPEDISLDRDRGMVNGFDLSWKTSELWVMRPNDTRVVKLLEDGAPDVSYVEQWTTKASPITTTVLGWYDGRHRNAVPVSTQEEIQAAQASGLQWALVPKAMKAILRKVRSWVIPSTKTPLERLNDLNSRYGAYLPEDARLELQDIIRVMSPKEDECESEK